VEKVVEVADGVELLINTTAKQLNLNAERMVRQ